MSHIERKSSVRSSEWTVATAKAKFSELLERAQTQGPQTIARHGRVAAVVVAASEWRRKTRSEGSLADFFAHSPLRDSGLNVRRRTKDAPRPVRL